MKIHPDVTVEMILEACERRGTTLDNPGFCMACGAWVDGVDPDGREYECEICGEKEVYGCEELALEMF